MKGGIMSLSKMARTQMNQNSSLKLLKVFQMAPRFKNLDFFYDVSCFSNSMLRYSWFTILVISAALAFLWWPLDLCLAICTF